MCDSGDVGSDVTEVDLPADESADVTEDIPEDIPEDEPEDIPEDEPEDIPEDEPEDIPEDEPEDIPEDEPEDIPEDDPEDTPEDIPEDIPEDTGYGDSKVLKRDELDLLKAGDSAINQRLEAQADDYRDRGLSEEEINERLVRDKWKFQQEFLNDAFPGQEVSPHVFNGLSENGAKDHVAEIHGNPLLREIIANERDGVPAVEMLSEDIKRADRINVGDEVYEKPYETEENVNEPTGGLSENTGSDFNTAETRDETTQAEIDNVIKDIVDQNVTVSTLPADGTGEWSNLELKGYGDFMLNDDAEIRWSKNGVKSKSSGAELKEWMRDNFGTDVVNYNHKEPDFAPFEDKTLGSVELPDMPVERGSGTYKEAEEKTADKLGWTRAEVQRYMKDNELTWHESADRRTVRAVPTRINAAFKHTGGISVQKSVKAMAQSIAQRIGGAKAVLQRDGFEGTVDAAEFEAAGAATKENYAQIKKDMFSENNGG